MSPESGAATILVVEDEPLVRDLAVRILRTAGFDVLTAADGPQGLDIVRAEPRRVDAVLLDVRLPTMSGPEILRELRGIRPDLAVVLSSGYGSPVLDGHAAGSGYLGFIDKPYRPSELIAKLREATGEKETS
jgi:CheY-like chemotaxis protein